MKRYDYETDVIGRKGFIIRDRRQGMYVEMARCERREDAEEIVTALNAWHEARVFVRAGLPVG